MSGGDPEREREMRAQAGQGSGRHRLGTDPVVADQPGQQRDGLGRPEDLDNDRAGALRRHQPAQPVPARDQDKAQRISGKQRPHLVGSGGIVQQDEHPPAGQRAAEQRGCFIGVHWLPLRVDAETTKQLAKRVNRPQRQHRGVAVQVNVELAAGEPGADPARPVNGERCLANPRGAGDRCDRDRVHAGRRVLEQSVEHVQLANPASELGR
jgi:hypothetical protein